MKKIRFLMLGGFLGAGKTTAIARLARHYIEQGLNVGLVTNDQAYDLVDTQSLRAQGFRVGEVPGACFCCKFNELIDVAGSLAADQQPDLIITEPVGSCTDLMATVIEPLRHLHGDRYEIAPLAVLLKPEHGQRILGQSTARGFSPKAEYIFLKQIEEADIVVLNKIDKLADEQREELVRLVEERFPTKTILTVSAKTGAGFEQLLEALDESSSPAEQLMDVDYQVYAEGEAELGWLNCTAEVRADEDQEFPLDDLLLTLVEGLQTALESAGAETAHLKVLGMADQETGIANLVGSGVGAELSLASQVQVPAAHLIVNARVATDPELLSTLVEAELQRQCAARGLTLQLGEVQRFRPSPPVPTHRVSR